MQRLRITFSRSGAVCYLAHLEMMRLWERALRRAGWRLTYSQGYNPHPKISFAAPLPVAVAGDAELLDLYLDEPRDPQQAQLELAGLLPNGIEIRKVEEVPVESAVLQKLMRAAEYRVQCPPDSSAEGLRLAAGRLLAAESLPRERAKESKVRSYDLRPMIRDLAVEEGADGSPELRLLLRTDAQGAGRPDEVLREMGIDPADCRITRTRLLLA
ncbi:MAG: TIGR03936 family radical SAM-associated protein [Chloroflexota bacterium]|jgi:radical SAM-linked protein